MEKVAVPTLTLSFAVDLDLEYNSFGGKTAEEIAEGLQEEVYNLLFEVSPYVTGVYTSVTAINSND